MEVSPKKRNLILSVLFFLPVAFILVMMLAKDNYLPLDIVKEGVKELPRNINNINFKDHITVLSFWGHKPMEKAVAALNLKEIIYDRSKGFKTFQIVSLVPHGAKGEAAQLLKKIKSYEDLRFWHFVELDAKDIQMIFNSLKSHKTLDTHLSTDAVFVIDKELNQRGRIDDRSKKDIEKKKPIYPLYAYDCIDVGVLKNKLSGEDMRILFTEYRQKRKGQFDNSSTRRAKRLNE